MNRLNNAIPIATEPGRTTAPAWPAFHVRQAVFEHEIEQAMALRRAVFCDEQGLFEGSDRDDIDLQARLLIAAACDVQTAHGSVLGTVRIHEASPRLWWGSRLAVQRSMRRQARLGEQLIRLAVSTAHGLGCETFLAHVQVQNVPLFEKLHWRSLDTSLAHGREHHLMQADLAHYPPCHDPLMGIFVDAGGQP